MRLHLGSRALHRLRIGGIVLLLAFGGVLIILAVKWPFTRKAVISSYEKVSRSNAWIGEFRRYFWPRPGYEAKSVTFDRGSGKPFATIATISAQTSWLKMLTFTHRIQRIDISGLRFEIPEHMPPPCKPPDNEAIKTVVEQLKADGAVLTIARPRKKLEFRFSKLLLHNMARSKAMDFDLVLVSSDPAAQIRTRGSLGPLQTQKTTTPLSGRVALERWNLAQYGVLGGTVSATASFRGNLGDLNVNGRSHISGFEVTSSHHAEDVDGDFDTEVNAFKGNVVMKKVAASFLHTALSGTGTIAPSSGDTAKTVCVDLRSDHARIEDLLYMLVGSPRPALDGPITLQGRFVIPPGNEKFLRKLQADGAFKIADSKFTNPPSEEKVSSLSERSQGEHFHDPKPVDAEMGSRVKLRDGVAHLSDGFFKVPGATARMNGTYNLLNEAVNLSGTLAMQASLSKAAGGFKSILLLPLDPLFKKGSAGAVVSVQMTGTYEHPHFHLSLKR